MRVLVDNIVQYDRIKALVQVRALDDVVFDFRHSPIESEIWL